MANTNINRKICSEKLFDDLSNDIINWIILRKFRDEEIESSNDIDLYIPYDQRKKGKKVIIKSLEKQGLVIANCGHHANLSYDIYAYKINEDNSIFSINIEVTNNIVWPFNFAGISIDIPYIDNQFLINTIQLMGKKRIMSNLYYSLHLIYMILNEEKKSYEDELKNTLQKLDKMEEKQLSNLIGFYINELKASNLIESIKSREVLRNKFKKRVFYGYIKSITSHQVYWQLEHVLLAIINKIKNIIKPPGLFILILGPDGIGKTAIGDLSYPSIQKLTKRCLRIHLGERPKFLNYRNIILPFNSEKKIKKTIKLGSNNIEQKKIRYAKPTRNKLINLYSTMRTILHFLDYYLEYLLIIYRKLTHGYIIIGERYFYDYSIINQRFPNTPQCIKQFLGHLIPKPDLNIVIHTDNPKEARERKPELNQEMFNNEMEEYLKNSYKYSKTSYIRNSTGNLNNSASELNKLILKALHNKNKYLLKS